MSDYPGQTSMGERAKRESTNDWIKSVSTVSGDGEYVQGRFYVRLHDSLSVNEQAELINSEIEHCTFSRNSSIVSTISDNEDRKKICPGVKVYHYHTQWRRKLDGCEDRADLENEFAQKQRDIVDLLANVVR